MPGVRHYQTPDDHREVDDAVSWVNVLALFNEMSHAERVQFIHYMGEVLYRLRNTDIQHLESRERVLSTLVARERVKVDT